jgi:hypothetical protein
VLTKVGQDGNNGTNARIFIPIETMRNLFRLKDQNSEDAISFLNYRPLTPSGNLVAKQEIHKSSPAATASIPSSKNHSKTGTPSKTTSASARFSAAWIIFSGWSA